MDFDYDTRAFDGLELTLRELESVATQKRVLKKALRAAAQPILVAMKTRYQQQFQDDTGLLSASFRLSVRTQRKTGVLAAYIGVQSRKSAMRATGKKRQLPPSVYASFLEHGTGAYTQAGTLHPGMPARPFIRPAFDQNIEQSLHRLAEALRAGLDKALARQNRKSIKT